MSRKRTFHVTQDAYVNKTITWEVEAESFEDAMEQVQYGNGEIWDESEWDTDYGDIDFIECQECCASYEEDCDCGVEVDDEFFASVGL